MTSLWDRFTSVFIFNDADSALTAERARNEEARARFAEMRVQHGQQERELAYRVAKVEAKVKEQQDAYARTAAPMLKEFDNIAISQHYYQEGVNSLTAQESFVDQMRQQEVQQFGYMSKKLISVSLNFEALRQKMDSGAPFAQELLAALEDAESDDLLEIAGPLRHFATTGVPKPTLVRAAAFDLARSIEVTGRAPAEQPVQGWLDLLKFRTAFSPSTVDQNEVRARRTAMQFTRLVEQNQYANALSLAEEVATWTRAENDMSKDYFSSSYDTFRRAAVPGITAEIFLAYASASLNASRFACVQHMLKE